MKIKFYKYQGTGNDFVVIDNRNNKIETLDVKKICDRKFGVGADGLMLLENSEISDFKMIYYNSDGNMSTMCGNGGRCIVAFAYFLKLISNKTTFEAIDGLHNATIENNIVQLQMTDVKNVKKISDNTFELNTGSPHYVMFVNDFEFDIVNEARKIRYNNEYKSEGINVNFVKKINNNTIEIRTYERGVEDETLSCGTGVTAACIVLQQTLKDESKISHFDFNVKTQGGLLNVSFDKSVIFENIFLTGNAEMVFEGEITL